MKATGIVRRIDDLGRIVVPKEIRRTMRLREGDPMEIFTAQGGVIMLKKYSPLQDMSALADSYVKTLNNSLGHTAFLCDQDQILAVAGMTKADFEGKNISQLLEETMQKRQIVQDEQAQEIEIIAHEKIPTKGYIIVPINVGGDVIGAFILVAQENALTSIDSITMQIIADIVAIQYE